MNIEQIDGEWIFEDENGNNLNDPHIRLCDGRISRETSGIDWKSTSDEHDATIKELKAECGCDEEVVCVFDGSDTYFYAIVNKR